jgi:hypothetical protein
MRFASAQSARTGLPSMSPNFIRRITAGFASVDVAQFF